VAAKLSTLHFDAAIQLSDLRRYDLTSASDTLAPAFCGGPPTVRRSRGEKGLIGREQQSLRTNGTWIDETAI
jgi:hypothetical protein